MFYYIEVKSACFIPYTLNSQRSVLALSEYSSGYGGYVVVVDDVSSVVRTGDVDRVRYSGSGVVGVPRKQRSVFFHCCV